MQTPANAAFKALLLCSVLLMVRTAAAAEVRTGERVHVPAGASVDEDLYAGAREVVIDGVVRGDVLAAGSIVTIHGRVEGSVMAAGGTVIVDGTVGHAVRVAGGKVRIDGEVGADALAACGSLVLGRAGKVGADLLAAGGELDLAGKVARGLRVAGDKVRLAGSASTDAQVRTGTLRVEESAAMPSLVYGAREAVSIPVGARIGHVENRPDWAPAKRPSRAGGSLLGALMALVTGVVLRWLMPERAARATQLLEQRPGAALLWGVGIAVASPVLIVLGIATVLALPLSMLAAVIYGFALYLGYLVSAQLLGELLLRKLRRPGHPLASLALGLAALLLVGLLPVLGSIAGTATTLAGFGALWLLLRDSAWFAARFRRPVAAASGAEAVRS